MGGELGSTRVTATEEEVLDDCAEETRSEKGVDDVDQHLVDSWWHTSDRGNDNKKGYTRCIEGRKHSDQCRRGNKWTV